MQRQVARHHDRLTAVHFSALDSPLADAFMPLLAEAARRHPDALFLRVALPPQDEAGEHDAEAAALQGMPYTLLLCGGELLGRIEVAGGLTPQAAARQLQATLMAAALQARMKRVDCAAMAFA